MRLNYFDFELGAIRINAPSDLAIRMIGYPWLVILFLFRETVPPSWLTWHKVPTGNIYWIYWPNIRTLPTADTYRHYLPYIITGTTHWHTLLNLLTETNYLNWLLELTNGTDYRNYLIDLHNWPAYTWPYLPEIPTAPANITCLPALLTEPTPLAVSWNSLVLRPPGARSRLDKQTTLC